MTDTGQNQSTLGDELRLAAFDDSGWEAIEILYTRYQRDPNDPRRAIAAPGSGVYCPGEDHKAGLRKFLDELKTGAKLPLPVCIRKRHCHDTWMHPVSPVDIYIGVPSYIVIELDESTGWQFMKNHPGITMQADHRHDNFNLGHVMPSGPDAGPNGPTGDGCRILYFSANQRPKFVHQQFHCHIDFGALIADPESVDPDIPNDGGKFPLHPESPCRGGRCGYPECD